MAQPIKKWMPNKAYYRAYRPKPDPAKDRIVEQAVFHWSDELDQLANDLSSLQLRSLRPNKTGRKINVRMKVGKKTLAFSVFPYQLKSCDFRTFQSLLQEVVMIVLGKMKLKFEGEEIRVSKAVEERAKLLFRRKYRKEMWFGSSVGFIAADYVRQRVSREGEFAAFYQAVLDFERQGKLDVNFDGHQVKRALDQYKEMAVHALRHGARLDDMQTILDEAVVQVTLEC
jgi:hypothetical protein